MNLKSLGKFATEKNLWPKALKDFSEEDVVALVKFLGRQAVDRLLMIGDIASRSDLQTLQEYYKRNRKEIEASIYSEELLVALAARASDFEVAPKQEPEQIKMGEN